MTVKIILFSYFLIFLFVLSHGAKGGYPLFRRRVRHEKRFCLSFKTGRAEWVGDEHVGRGAVGRSHARAVV